jgi:hypothetical protein
MSFNIGWMTTTRKVRVSMATNHEPKISKSSIAANRQRYTGYNAALGHLTAEENKAGLRQTRIIIRWSRPNRARLRHW